ncbi:hypothetical protein JHN59_40055 [Streptomyces sp. MBT49]|uniref:hypothetical protein n=1 Tax=unclassified Streptomyces TaxID=2593676 RepID=UPI00190D36E3|nr:MULTISPECIES: hypothetical protein [unclassified Streptomyces]MBK3630881.1 hypothetical protein [Streptomyces sp. MBT49]MBK3638170.1 hypothetical protein [Streptomyces sp. MBT97]
MVTHEMMVLAFAAALGAVFLPLRTLQRLCALIAAWAALCALAYTGREVIHVIGRAVEAGAR